MRFSERGAMGTIIGLALLLAACSQNSTPSTKSAADEVLRRGLGGEPASLDPAAATDNFSTQVLQDLYEGLTIESPVGEVAPGVASSWTVDASGTKYTFTLRPNAVWSNGKRVRAKDFVVAWQRILDPKHSSPVANILRPIAGAAAILAGKSPVTSLGAIAVSDNELLVYLEQPTPYFPQLLSYSAAFPIFSDTSARTHDPNAWISNGPYVLSNWQIGTKIDLSQNMAYWDHANVRIHRVQYQIAPDQNAQFAAYRSGQLDMTDGVPATAIAALRENHSKELVMGPLLATVYYELNLSANPFSGNPKLRKALAMAINRQQLVDALGTSQLPAYALVPPGTWNYDLQEWQWSKLNDSDRVAEARKLYKEAGYSSRAPLHLRLLFNSSPAIKRTAIVTAAMWKEDLGIDTELVDEEFRVFLESRRDTTRWEVLRLAWTADYNDASSFLDVFRRNSLNNDSRYSNPMFDSLLDEASVASRPEIRRDLLETAERLVLDDYPAIPLYFGVSKRLVKPYVLGVTPSPLDRIGSKSLSILPH
jgi:oligopeptide transport system substrate-binding protein